VSNVRSNLACADIVKHRGLGERAAITNYFDGTNPVVVTAWNWDYLRTAIDGATNVSLKPYFVSLNSIPGRTFIDGQQVIENTGGAQVWINNEMRYGSLDPLKAIVSNCWCGAQTNFVYGGLYGAPSDTYTAYALAANGVNSKILKVKLDTRYTYTVTNCLIYVAYDTTGNYTGSITCVGSTPTEYSIIETGDCAIAINIVGNSIAWNATFGKTCAARPNCPPGPGPYDLTVCGDGGYVEFHVVLTNWATDLSLDLEYDDDGSFP
jgi:hypothetical protein